MKKHILIVLLAFFTFNIGFAQTRTHPGQVRIKRTTTAVPADNILSISSRGVITRSTNTISSLDATILDNRIVVTQANAITTLGTTIDPTKEYFLDGIIDLTGLGFSIEVPTGGINIRGFGFEISKLISSDNNFTLFTSPVGGSGDYLALDFGVEITGTNSKVYDLEADTGIESYAMSRISYNNCTSLGEVDGYGQGVELSTNRLGGTPTLTLSGTWSGGYRITTSLVRSLSAGMTTPLFKEGTSFTMGSRFLTDINCDLPTSAAFMDFQASNFINPSSLVVRGALFTRNGVVNPTDTNIFSAIEHGDLQANFTDNIGVENTFEGGEMTISTEIATVIAATSTFVDLAGTFTVTQLEHFDSPANGQLRHLGDTPREFRIVYDLVLDATANNELEVKIVIFDDSASSFVDGKTQVRQVISLQGGRDVAFVQLFTNIILDKNDFVKLQVANNTSIVNITAELDSYVIIEER